MTGRRLLFVLIAVVQAACAPFDPYRLVDQSLLADDPKRADAVIEQAEQHYGTRSRLLYEMDRGMTLHLAGDAMTPSGVPISLSGRKRLALGLFRTGGAFEYVMTYGLLATTLIFRWSDLQQIILQAVNIR